MAQIKNVSPLTVILRTVNNKTYDILPGQTLSVPDAEVSYDNVDSALQSGQIEVTTDSGEAFFKSNGSSSYTAPVTSVKAESALPVANVKTAIREAFEVYDKTTRWSEVLANGDIIMLDGNTAAASYLVISKDPLSAGTESSVTSRTTFTMPSELIVGVSLSQRAMGQEFSIELVSDEPSIPYPDDVAIASVSQSGTTLTVNTVAAHGLRPGMRVGIRDSSDCRMNYAALVVGTTPSPTQFTATHQPGSGLPSLTVGPIPGGFVYWRAAMGGAPNGTSQVFESTNAQTASIYVRSEAGDVLPSGTVGGSHSVSCGTTVSASAAVSAMAYCFQPSTEYRCVVQPDMLTWLDGGVDTVIGSALRQRRTQVIPDHTLPYKVRFRAVNRPSLTRPVARIVSATKSGSSNVTVVTDVPHGLVAGDIINIYGVRDGTNFPNITNSTTPVASVVDANTFVVGWGTASTNSSFGGFVARVNGGQTMQGVVNITGTTVSRTGGLLSLFGAVTWSGISIGDYVNVVGLRSASASFGADGAYRVRDMQGMTLLLEPIGNTPAGEDFALAQCGAAVIRRTDMRVSYVRVLDYERQRVESAAKATTDVLGAMAVAVNNSPTVFTIGSAAEDAAATSNPVLVAGLARTALPPSTIVAGDVVRATYSVSGQLITKEFAPRDLDFQVATAITTNTQTAIRAAQASGVRQNITSITYQNANATATAVTIQDGSNTLITFVAAANMPNPVQLQFPTPLQGSTATALNYQATTAGANVFLQVTGFNSY